MSVKAVRGTTNRNDRGSSSDRRARKQWLMETFGDGTRAACSFGCGVVVTVDRHPVPGWAGGRYVRGNIRPACLPCNSRDGARQMQGRRGQCRTS